MHQILWYWVYWTVFAYIFHYWVMFIKCRAYYDKRDDPELMRKFAPFMRNDMHTWHDAIAIILIPTAVPRLALGTLLLMIYGVSTTIIMIGVDADRIDKYRLAFIRYMGYFVCRSILFIGGVVWLETKRVEDADYRKWLGPDWKPQWSGSGTLIANHISGFMDVLAAMVEFYPAFVSKKSVKNYPFIGTIACANDSIFLNRQGTKEEKEEAMRAIEAR